jgi:hypothetical protein
MVNYPLEILLGIWKCGHLRGQECFQKRKLKDYPSKSAYACSKNWKCDMKCCVFCEKLKRCHEDGELCGMVMGYILGMVRR